jgi:N-acetylneuraminate synthase
MKPVDIGGASVGDGSTFVIAEAGSNHNNDLSMAKELVDVAADAGVDAVKFQTFRAETMYPEESGVTDYLETDTSLYDLVESMEMPFEWIPELRDYCEEHDVVFLSTPTDRRAVDELADHVPAYKIASFTMSHHPFLEYVARQGKPVILSTGAHDMLEVREAVETLRAAGLEDIVVLQCISSYPAPLESMNVRVINRFVREFGVPSGLSDHTLDPTTAPTAAVSVGGHVVEKHFTLDRSLEGPDHSFALEPDELDEMVTAIRKTERALGTDEKTVQPVEEEMHDIARRRIHASTDIKTGEQLSEDNIRILRSGKNENGLVPKFYDEIIGMRVTEHVPSGNGITWDVLRTDDDS